MHKNLRRLLATSLLTAVIACGAWAIKANRQPVTITQPDGTAITLRIVGDESRHTLTTLDGYPVMRNAAGYYCYLETDSTNGRFRISNQKATNPQQRGRQEAAFVTRLASILNPKGAAKVLPMLPAAAPMAPAQVLNQQRMKARLKARAPQEGTPESHYLVILVRYADVALHHTVDEFANWLNEPGYATNGGTGSVKDYYRDNSYGQFVPNFTVLGPITLDYNQLYYAANDADTGSDVNPEAMVIEAVKKAKEAHPEIDFSQFDNDGDGFMDNVNIIYSGYSEASTGNSNDMWPHSYNLAATARQFEVDGITVNNYAVSAELVGASGTSMDGIGTFVHEFGHVLGLKDTYDTDSYQSGIAIHPGDFSLYASGSYNNQSRTPPCLMAFERQQMGWMTLEPVNKAENVSLAPISDNVARYIDAQPTRDVYTEGGDWFVLENRQQVGWDRYIPAHGLLIYHYDFTKESIEKYWSVNSPNSNAAHRCLYIVPADGVDDDLTRRGDTYPGTTGTTEFTDLTHPDALSWTGEPLRTPLTQISESADGMISFLVKGGTTAAAPFVKTVAPKLASITATSATVGLQVTNAPAGIKQTGFCWSSKNAFPTTADSQLTLDASAEQQATLDNLTPATRYYVRAFFTDNSGTTTYGAPVPVRTEHQPITAPAVISMTEMNDDGELARWRIVDNNADGTTWQYDESSQALIYQLDYWNDADDWLISEKINVPQRGALYIARGVTDPMYVERLDVYVSTQSRDVADFHLVQSLSLADHFGEQTVDEVDLSDFAGKQVYVAIVAHSERLQGVIWLWAAMVTSRLDTPQITEFGAIDGGLRVAWDEVPGASTYYLSFSEVTNETKETTYFLPTDDIALTTGSPDLATGMMRFTADGSVTTRKYDEGITDVSYLILVSGPRGTSTLSIEGSDDGVNWHRIGEPQRFSANTSEGTPVLLSGYLKGTNYTQLRAVCQYGGRMITVRNFTITYRDGTVWNELAAGAVGNQTSIDILEKTPGEFSPTKRYAATVYAGDGMLYYDGSTPAFYQASAGIAPILSDASTASSTLAVMKDGVVSLTGLTVGRPTAIYALDGRLLHRFTPQAASATVRLATPMSGFVVIK